MKEKGTLLFAGGASKALNVDVVYLKNTDLKGELEGLVGSCPAPENGTFVFTDVESIRDFVERDSYVLNGIVDSFDVREVRAILKD